MKATIQQKAPTTEKEKLRYALAEAMNNKAIYVLIMTMVSNNSAQVIRDFVQKERVNNNTQFDTAKK